MKLGAPTAMVIGFALFLLVGCGGPTTPDTEGQTLTQARQTLRDAGVPEENITVVGGGGDSDELVVCDHDPDGAAPTESLRLEVATVCPDDDSDRKRKRSSGGRRR